MITHHHTAVIARKSTKKVLATSAPIDDQRPDPQSGSTIKAYSGPQPTGSRCMFGQWLNAPRMKRAMRLKARG